MAIFKVKVKWGKETFADVELDISEPPLVFKAQVFALTGVEPHRQKIMFRGSTVKDDTWDGFKIKDGISILMMGSKEEDIPLTPVERPTFLEDMTEAELNSALDLPVGLKNLGNTCYLNAVVQCFKCVPELYSIIKEFKPKNESSPKQLLTMAFCDTYKNMESNATVMPFILVNLLRSVFPRFSEQDDKGMYMQQDASECWTEVMRLFQEMLPSVDLEKSANKFNSSLVDQYFSGEFKCTWKCLENEEEESNITYDKFMQLSCHISQDVKYLQSGLIAKMKEQITKRSATLDKDALYEKTSEITRLPAYLTVEMVRFFYKEKENINAKILKDVKFPLILDMFEFCTKDLQLRLTPVRSQYKEMEERQLEEERSVKREREEIKKVKTKKMPFSFEDDLGGNNNGFYQLEAVLTHQGRSSSSGHYVAWTRFRGKEWLKCDDEDITAVLEDDVLRLSGGGDWHCAYILLYGPRILEVVDTEEDREKMETE